jgi:putative molybdopterin biosynthesis protein
VVKRYLNVVSLDAATEILRTRFACTPFREVVPLLRSVGRMTAEPIFARYSVPEVHLAAMDGIAVASEKTRGASEQHPLTLDHAVRVNTGNVVPPECDAVIMIEDVHVDGDRFTIRKAAPPWQHIRPAGEDIGESEMALPSRHLIRPPDIGALAAYGITDVSVLSVRIGLIPTGSELVPYGTSPAPGQVVESNTVMAEAMLGPLGTACTRYPMVTDDPVQIRQVLMRAVAENDVVIISAGSSAGTKDFTADVIAEVGEVLVHGIAIRPGKPAIIGSIENKPVIGMPGYPLSALTIVREIVIPLMECFGLPVPSPGMIEANLTSMIHKDIGSDEFILCSLGKVGSRWVISPQSRGAGVQMSAVRSNAYMKIPAAIEGFEAGATVPATLSVPHAVAERALLVTGSHDPVLDYLADLLQQQGFEIHSTHAGSMGGILALKKNECHAAPMHLLADDGDYNIPYLHKYLPGEDVILICVAGRQQGIVSKNGIGFEELPGHTFVNRQRGSGTRMLLDHQLKLSGINPSRIQGYEREVTTHLAVALAVKSGEAEAGMCVYSAAKALRLGFVPVALERYELAIRREHLDDRRVAALCTAIASPGFTTILDRLGGYDTRETGVRRVLP